ncbi:MAG: alginate O-acetyltransferase AlgX-related protein [Planctomycetota bacterium]
MTEAKGKSVFLVTAFIAIIFSVGLVQAGIELSRSEMPQVMELFLQPPTKANLRAFEKDLERACWFSRTLRPWMQYMQFVVLKDAGDKALIGRKGWLFYKPGVRYLMEKFPVGKDSVSKPGDCVSAVLSFRNQLAARGIQLLVVPVPGKASVYPDMLTSKANRIKRPVNSHTLETISKLRQAGIEVVDLGEVFSQARAGSGPVNHTDYYLPQDTHWSPEGMRLAANSVARRILDLGWVAKGTVEYDLKSVTTKRYGDILQMMRVPQIERRFKPIELNCTQVVHAGTGRLYRDDPMSEILVLGDSFLRMYERDQPGSGGFIAHLARQLKSPITSIVNDGGASTLVRQQLSRKPAILTDKKLLIWEFVERDIRFGKEGWQQIPLPLAEDK